MEGEESSALDGCQHADNGPFAHESGFRKKAEEWIKEVQAPV
jgi:hypothetical protein